MPEQSKTVEMPHIADHMLIRAIGKGAYGEVWLAKNVLDSFRAVKVIYRGTFSEDRPFEREFEGIQKFEPISRTHPGLVAVLHVGKCPGYFYYVMELADDVQAGAQIIPATYSSKTLRSELNHRGRLPFQESLQTSLALLSALRHLHERGLIHRDIKPSNIIFVNGAPKFADVGLVTDAGEGVSFVGSPGYMPPEGPGGPAGDVYSLGKVFYELFMGKACKDFPDLPTPQEEFLAAPALREMNEVILRACHIDARQRYQTANDLREAVLAAARAGSPSPAPGNQDPRSVQAAGPTLLAREGAASRGGRTQHVAIAYKAHAQPDGRLLDLLHDHLTRHGYRVFIDRHLTIGVEWAQEIEDKIRHSDAVIVLLSAASNQSEMVAYEVEIAHETVQQRGKPALLPVRVAYSGPLSEPLGRVLNPLQHCLWESPADDQRLLDQVIQALENPPATGSASHRTRLEPVGGAVPLDSKFYVVRPVDEEFRAAIARQDSVVLVKGARQMGKTSLLARGLQQAREAGTKVILTDFQTLNTAHLESAETLFLTMAEWIASQLDLEASPQATWNPRSGPNMNFQRFLRREVLEKLPAPLVWGLDEVDRLFSCQFGSEVFGLFRSWHNARSLDPSGPWSRLTLAIAYATEAHLFITDVNQSPFNVGTRLTLEDFTLGQVADLNQRYGSPLHTNAELSQFYQLVGGHPYLVRRGLHELVTRSEGMSTFAAQTDRDEGVFGDHLRRILVLLAKSPELMEIVRGLLQGRPCPSLDSFYRLRTAGLLTGDSPHDARPRCQVYETYLKRHLL
jgi:hypothetical protein